MPNVGDLSTVDLSGSQTFLDRGYPHAASWMLREEARLRFSDLAPRPGFWAVLRRADSVWL